MWTSLSDQLLLQPSAHVENILNHIFHSLLSPSQTKNDCVFGFVLFVFPKASFLCGFLFNVIQLREWGWCWSVWSAAASVNRQIITLRLRVWSEWKVQICPSHTCKSDLGVVLSLALSLDVITVCVCVCAGDNNESQLRGVSACVSLLRGFRVCLLSFTSPLRQQRLKQV